jgi:hypothetical protein
MTTAAGGGPTLLWGARVHEGIQMPVHLQRWLRPSLVLGGITLLLHLLFNAGYGINRDELYFIVCGQHLAWGYVDQPPLVPMLAAWSYALSGDWLTGFRLVPALALSATVVMTAEFVRLTGGGRFAQWLAGLCTALAPQFLAIGMIFVADIFQPISWLACAWILVRLEQTKDERWQVYDRVLRGRTGHRPAGDVAALIPAETLGLCGRGTGACDRAS